MATRKPGQKNGPTAPEPRTYDHPEAKTLLRPDVGTQASSRKRPLHPPGRDVRCIVSVAMLTEGWDCNTVTHIIGLRPFMSQLLCEQVVGRGLRRTSYEVDENDRLSEEVAKILGVPFEIVPFKANAKGPSVPRAKPHHVRALPERAALEIRFPVRLSCFPRVRKSVSASARTWLVVRATSKRRFPRSRSKISRTRVRLASSASIRA
jgi:superfamily II DNA or RNA helicase